MKEFNPKFTGGMNKKQYDWLKLRHPNAKTVQEAIWLELQALGCPAPNPRGWAGQERNQEKSSEEPLD